MTRRTDRLGEQFREEISKLIQKGLKDPRVSTLASITPCGHYRRPELCKGPRLGDGFR